MTAPPEGLASAAMRHGMADPPASIGTPIAVLAKTLREAGFVWFLADLAGLPADLVPATASEMTAAGAQPAGMAREGWLARRRLARHVLAEALGNQRPEDLQIAPDSLGRPEFSGIKKGWHLSFAARGERALIGIAHAPLGVDLEIEKPDLVIPSNILRPDERAWLAEQPEALRIAAFCRIWTAKEAIVKALGTGFRLPPEAIHLPADEKGHVDIRIPPESPGNGLGNWPDSKIAVLTREGIRVFVSRPSGEERSATLCCSMAWARAKSTSRGGWAP